MGIVGFGLVRETPFGSLDLFLLVACYLSQEKGLQTGFGFGSQTGVRKINPTCHHPCLRFRRAFVFSMKPPNGGPLAWLSPRHASSSSGRKSELRSYGVSFGLSFIG